MWNKADLLDPDAAETAGNLAARRDDVYLGSALTGEGLDPLLDRMASEMTDALTDVTLLLPFDAGRARAWLHDAGAVAGEHPDEGGTRLELRWTSRQAQRFAAEFPGLIPGGAPPPDGPEPRDVSDDPWHVPG